MALSVGLGRIVNDPDAPIRTRKALGRLATPGLLVTDEGLTINSDGRIVLKLSVGLQQGAFGLAVRVKSEGGISAGTFGLTEDDQGISIQLAPNSRLKLSNEGLALDDPLGDITVTNITVSQNATIAGNVAVSGILDTTIINSDTIINTGVISSDSLTVTGNASVGGTFTVATMSIATLAVSGNASITGLATIGNLAVTGSVGIGGNALVTGSINAATGVIGVNQLTAIGLITGNIQANNIVSLGNLNSASQVVTGVSQIGSLNCSGNASVGGTLTAVTFNPSSITTGTINATIINATHVNLTGDMSANRIGVGSGGTIITRIYLFYVTATFSGGAGSYPLETFAPIPGLGPNDGLSVSISGGVYGTGFVSWSAATIGFGTIMIRVWIQSTAVFSVTPTFLVTALQA